MNYVMRVFFRPVIFNWKNFFGIKVPKVDTNFEKVNEAMTFQMQAHEQRLRNSLYL